MHSRTVLLALSTMILAAPVMAHAQGGVPKPFTLLPGERTSVPFGVAGAGPLTVQVQAQGQPLIVSVNDARGSELAQQQGMGTITVTVPNATGAAAGSGYWMVTVRGARDGAGAAMAMRTAPRPIATGTIAISGPVMSEKQLAELISPRDAATRQVVLQKKQAMASAAAPMLDASPARAALLQQVAQTQRSQLTAISAKLPPATVAQVQQRIDLRARGEIAPIAIADRRMTAGMAAGVAQRAPAPATASQSQAAGGVSPVGTTTAAAVAAPAITTLSVRQGAPGAPVLIEGIGLGDQQGEVHFIVASGIDLTAPVTYWSATQVVTEVPTREAVPAFDGYVYIKRPDGTKSAVTPFAFQPTADVAIYCVGMADGDIRIGAPGEDIGRSISQPFHYTAAAGFAGYDEFNQQTHLKNGWRVAQVEIRREGCQVPGIERPKDNQNNGAYVAEWRPGTDSPYVKVRWWMDGVFPLFSSNIVSYTVAITVTGPKGLPYR